LSSALVRPRRIAILRRPAIRNLHPMTIEPPETEIVSTWRVACDGGEGALGHPRVWLQIPEDTGWVECPYCDCKYIYADKAAG